MTYNEKISIVRIFIDIIKADKIIDVSEIEKYVLLKKKYNLSREYEIQGLQMTLAESLNTLADSDELFKRTLLADCLDMAMSDGFCARSEALLMIALKNIFTTKKNQGIEVLSISNPTFNIDSSSILYIESQFDVSVNDVIKSNYRTLYKETQIAGFNFIYIPTIIQHYKEADKGLLMQIIAFLAPSFSDEGIENIIKELYGMTTASFCKDLLCNKFGMSLLRDAVPSLLVKIGCSYVDEEIYTNYLKIEIDEKILLTIQNIIDDFLAMLSSDSISVTTAEERFHQFLYHGFYKQLLDIFLVRKNVRSKLFINPYKEEISFPNIGRKLDKLHRREKALYVLLLIMSHEGGVNFNLPKSANELSAYKNKHADLQNKYQVIYGFFGGDKAPDLSQAEIRRPIISCLKRSLSVFDGLLYNVADYTIYKNEYGDLNINLEKDLLYIYDSKSKSMVYLFDSELYKRVKSL